MEIRKLDRWEEWMESDRIIGTAFLLGWNEKESEERFRKQAGGEEARNEEAWGVFNEDGVMYTSFVTSTRNVMFDEQVIPISEINMVASLPEYRNEGNVRKLMAAVLRDFRSRGDVFAVLHPFSFAFYRKFGFDLITKNMTQKLPVGELKNFTCRYKVHQVRSEKDLPTLRLLYETYIRTRNLAPLRTDRDWVYRGNGEVGQPDWFSREKQSYTYLFSDEAGAHAYLKFVFNYGPEGPFNGDMRVSELIYDSPEAFKNVMGFIYGMRAKLINVILEIPDVIDLSVLIPECNRAEQTLGGHLMGRVLDPEKVLTLMKQPEGSGSYTIRINDDFLEENTGIFTVRYQDGKTVSVSRETREADLVLDIRTFSQLASGMLCLEQALYREGTVLKNNKAILKQLFGKKLTYAS